MVYVYVICVIFSISLNFQLTVYGLGHSCPAVSIPGDGAADLQGKYREEDYGGASGWGSAS